MTSGQNGVAQRLSELYRKAIRQNTDPKALRNDEKMEAAVGKMKNAILAVLHHEVKLPDSLWHQYCPDGDDSWCQYKKNGKTEDQKHHLDPVFYDLLKPVFEPLSDDKLLKQCIPGHLQNQNRVI